MAQHASQISKNSSRWSLPVNVFTYARSSTLIAHYVPEHNKACHNRRVDVFSEYYFRCPLSNREMKEFSAAVKVISHETFCLIPSFDNESRKFYDL